MPRKVLLLSLKSVNQTGIDALMFNKVLIANRGEIAVRIIRSVRDAGYRSVAVYSEADRQAAHVALADEAVCIGPAPASESYLVAQNVLNAAKLTGADAIHPGYGFLSESAEFAQSCLDAGHVFIGPSPEAIGLMGNKRVAKQRMIDAGVPCIPGYQGEDQSDENLLKEAGKIGFPLMIKAAAGGGGRGMRALDKGANVKEALASARAESLSAFGSDELILERAVVNGRHIEIQVVADQSGQVVYLGERDCSIQRRHQKVIEEAPSPFVDEKLRHLMGQAAVNAAAACHYCGAGTVEFLVDEDGVFYFLEMNTRLQVEHPVTELVTGVDLVDWQLQIAAGYPLPLAQEDIVIKGHAIEARLYAEDPANGFMPQTGHIHLWQEAEGAGIRIDHGVAEGTDVSPYYDSMLGKIIAFGRDREQARRRVIRAISDSHLLGVVTNRTFLKQILSDQRFINGQATTAFIDQATLDQATHASNPLEVNLALAVVLLLSQKEARNGGLWRWSNVGGMAMRVTLSVGEDSHTASVEFDGTGFKVRVDEAVHDITLHAVENGRCTCSIDGVRQTAFFVIEGTELFLEANDQSLIIEDTTYAPVLSEDEAGSGHIVATTEGLVILVGVKPGDKVEKGQTLVTIEAMKMEHRLTADTDGTVINVPAVEGTQVKKGQLMAEIEIESSSEEEQ